MAKQQKTVADIMSTRAEFVSIDTSIEEAARKMQALDCGFLPISDAEEQRLLGVVTDRDIVLRGVAQGKDPRATRVDDIKSNKVLYCFRGDSLESAATSMHDKQVYRLVVLDDDASKNLCGIISLNDIVRHDERGMAASVAAGIAAAA